MRQQLYLNSRFGWNLGAATGPGGGAETLFWMQDPIVLTSPRHAFTLSVPFVAVPLAHYFVSAANQTSEIVYPAQPEPSIIKFSLGNHSIDELVDLLNRRLFFGFKAVYSENTNTLRFTSQSLGAELSIEPATTCGSLIGLHAEDTTVLGSYTAPDGVNLTGTTCFYLRFNLQTRNRDPSILGYSSIIANVPITKPHNGLELLTQSGFTFDLNDRSIHYIIIEILDDAQEPVNFCGGEWHVTLEFGVEEVLAYAGPTDYWVLMANGSLLGNANIATHQRSDAASG